MRRFPIRLLLPLALLTLCSAVAAVLQLRPTVYDLNKVTGVSGASNPNGAFVFDAGVLFAATDATGTEPWITDGTAAGTFQLANLASGPLSSFPMFLVQVGNKVLFAADDGISGVQPWLTDGTDAGTAEVPITGFDLTVAPVAQGTNAYFIANGYLEVLDTTDAGTRLLDVAAGPLVPFGGEVYYVNTTDTTLWRTDSTVVPVGRVELTTAAAVQPGAATLATPGALYFAGNDATHGVELFVTQGTAATTVLLVDSNPGPLDGDPTLLTAFGAKVLFLANAAAGPTLDVTDGTPGGTLALAVVSGTTQIVTVGSKALFSNYDTTHGNELWVTDGTVAGTRLLVDIVAGIGYSNPTSFVSTGSRAWFIAQDAAGFSLWTSDGSVGGTVALAEAVSPTGLFVSGATLWFGATDATHGLELWHSDGTLAGTSLVADLNAGTANGFSQVLAGLGSKVLFSADDGTHGIEPWISDGTVGGTQLLRDIGPVTTGSSNPDPPVAVGTTGFLTANDGTHGLLAWRITGNVQSVATDVLVVPNPTPFATCPTPAQPNLTLLGNRAFFIGTSTTNPTQPDLYAASTQAGTNLADESSGTATVTAGSIIGVLNDELYFIATSNRRKHLMRVATGQPENLGDIGSDTPTSLAQQGTVVGNRLVVVTAEDAGIAQTLLVSDGTASGTARLANFVPSTDPVGPPVVSDGAAYFPVKTATDTELYFTDGQTFARVNGAVVEPAIRELVPFAGGALYSQTAGASSGPALAVGTGFTLLESTGGAARYFTVVGTLAYFVANDGTHGTEIHVTDGTPGVGTHLLVDLRNGALGSNPVILGGVGSKLIFTADDGQGAGQQLWSYAPSGQLTLLATLNIQLQLGGLPQPTFYFNRLYFAGHDDLHGTQLWVTDGTANGTGIVSDAAASPSNFGIVNDKLFFSALDPFRGRELFSIPLDTTAPVVTPVLNGTLGGNGYYVSDVAVSWSIVENESPVTAQVGCTTITLTADSPGTVVSCAVTSAGGTSTSTATVKRDTTRPVLVCSPQVFAEATSAAGAAVTYPLPNVQDAIDPMPTLVEDRSPGSMFPLGDTTVMASATDAAGNTQTCTFTITVRDTTPPVAMCPASVTAPATSPAGAAVTFMVSATDTVDASPMVSTVPASGSTLPVGSTLVTARAVDASGNASSCEFLVTVQDSGGPTLSCPPNQTANAGAATTVAVTYPAPTVSDAADPMPLVMTSHDSGDSFPVGTTTVDVTATNHSGASSTCHFTVDVQGGPGSHCGCDGAPGTALAAAWLALGLLRRRRSRRG